MINVKQLFVIFFLSLGFFLYAEAPELKNVMPNSWQKVTRITGEEEQRVIEECDKNIKTIISMIEPVYNYDREVNNTDINNLHIKTYKQQVGSDTFYRFFVSDRETDTYDEYRQQHIQVVVWDKEENHIIVGAGVYSHFVVHQYGNDITYASIDIIESGGTAKAALIGLYPNKRTELSNVL
jgi:hypothetical protein